MDEPEVITFKEFVERNKDIKEEELYKVVLVCKNCNHKDLLKNFIREKKMDWAIAGDDTIFKLRLKNKEYEDMFFCPKCDSSLVVLCKEFTKNNILRGLNENKEDRIQN